MGMAWTIWTNFHSPIPRRLHMKFGPVVSEEKMFENVDTHKDDKGLPVYYKLTNEPLAQVS